MSKMKYKIADAPRHVGAGLHMLDCWDVEWTHEDGPFKDYDADGKVVGEREIVHDQIEVNPGTKRSIVMEKCEEKMAVLAKNLNVSL